MVSGYNRYANAQLQMLAHQLHIDTLTFAEGVHLLCLSDSDSIVVINDSQTIVHIGYSLFNNQMREQAVFRFLERYLLMLNYPFQGKTLSRMLRDDEVKILKGSPSSVRNFRATDKFTCNQTDSRYQAEWTRAGTVILRLQFPASYQLLSGNTKTEAENRIPELIKATKVTEHADSSSYFSHLPLPVTQQLAITFFRYGYVEETIHTTLAQWMAFCRQTGCKIEYGIESEEKDLLHVSLLAVNKAEGYNHVMALTLREKGNHTATLHAYVPMHNVRQLFANNRKTKSQNKKLYVR
jgi:hypothetical protein